MRRNSVFVFIFYVAILCIPQYAAAQTSGSAGEVLREEGVASWYGTEFDGRPTASGEIFNSALFTAAHPSLPFGTFLKVTNKQNNRWVTVKVNDRGPFVASRIIDLSQAAAIHLDMISAGTVPVIIETLPGSYASPPRTQAAAPAPAAPPPPAYTPPAISQAPAAAPEPPPPPYAPPPAYTQAPPPPAYTQAPPPPPAYTQSPPPPPAYTQAPPPPAYTQAPPPPAYTQAPPPPAYTQAPPPPAYTPPPPAYTPPPPAVPEPIAPVEYSYIPYAPMVYSPFYIQPPQLVQSPYPAATAFPPPPVPPVFETVPPSQLSPLSESLPLLPPQTPPAPEIAQPSGSGIKLIPALNPMPDKKYRLQVGSFKIPRNAVEVFSKLKAAGLNPTYEQNGELYRVVLTGIRGTEVQPVADKLEKAGFREVIIREEN